MLTCSTRNSIVLVLQIGGTALFIKLKFTARSAVYLEAIHSHRVDGRVQQQLVCYLGRLALNGPGCLGFWLQVWERLEKSGLSAEVRQRIVDLLLEHVPCPVIQKPDPANPFSGFNDYLHRQAGRPPLPFGKGQLSAKIRVAVDAYASWMAEQETEQEEDAVETGADWGKEVDSPRLHLDA